MSAIKRAAAVRAEASERLWKKFEATGDAPLVRDALRLERSLGQAEGATEALLDVAHATIKFTDYDKFRAWLAERMQR